MTQEKENSETYMVNNGLGHASMEVPVTPMIDSDETQKGLLAAR
jgi:hypothetical protein